MYEYHWGMGFNWLIWIIIMALLVWIILRTGTTISSGKRSNSAIDILKERYAKGEIGKEEFEEKKKDLMD